MNLLNSLSGTGDDYYGLTSNYSYIIVTNSDISAQMKTSPHLNRSQKLRKNVFLVSPLMEKSSEYQNYFETMANTADTKGDQPLIHEYKRANQTHVPDMSVSLMAKAVWALSLAYQNLFQKQCAGNKVNCNLSTNANLTDLMINSLKNLNAVISESGLKDLNGVRLRFDSEGKLMTWKYHIMIIASNWQTISLGFYSLDNGLNIDTKFMQTILANRINRFRTRPKSMIKAIHKNQLSSLPSNNMHTIYKQPLYGNVGNSSMSASSLMRSTVKHQLTDSSAPIERRMVSHDFPSLNTSSARPSNLESNYVTRKRYNSLTIWLGTVWSLTILSSSILGILITLYVQTFLLMKSCEGALRKANQALVICHLVAVAVTFLGSSL
ncbi:unnamed protein product [Medioppia subpectinata]|uniref:Receptor ligand binding region domain-containing protein n=1 Tax=Medioppia subpectinata TaxID=1979941 RepID=A0A7R9Q1A8_9ACAR|nr:unnamed protein product [Medioppia subpectinata]CAG2109012.1 unnamed protein product [Medioppia subpectinata]